MRRTVHPLTAAVLAAGLCWVGRSALGQGPYREPVYVGSGHCARCHRGGGMGGQWARWLRSAHARAYAALADPRCGRIARLSGVPVEPQRSPICLGCHATAAAAEPWERDQTFHLVEGVQCESCHGPGSEYSDAGTMRNRSAAVAAGLLLPEPKDCMRCHDAKGSHVRVLGANRFDVEKAWQRIAHPTPETPRLPPPRPAPPPGAKADAPKYVGSAACAACHHGRAHGYQYSRWRSGPHARAYAVLLAPAAGEYARQMKVSGDPSTAPACLKCHATGYAEPAGGVAASWQLGEGVGCESCHGPGSRYAAEAIMRDARAARAAGLRAVTKQTCLACHADAHGKPFDHPAAARRIAHPTKIPLPPPPPQYKTPLNLAFRPGTTELYVACEASHSVVVVDAAARKKLAEIPVGRHPVDVTFDPDGRRAYVSNRLDDSVSVIDAAARRVVATIGVGDEPHGLLTDAAGRRLYVLNTSSDSISVIDTGTLREEKRLEASRAPWSLARSPDGRRILVTNTLSRFVPPRRPPLSELTVVDTAGAVVADRLEVPGANLVQGAAWEPGGRFALVTLNRTKNLVPMTRLLQGWTITNGLGIALADGRVDQVLLDEPGMCFPDPADVAFTPDGRLALVSSSGSNRLAVVDVAKLAAMVKGASDYERKHVLPNHLGRPTEFVLKHIPTADSPRGVVVSPDGRTAFVANALDDSLTVVDIPTLAPAGRIDLGGPKQITKVRLGERLFHSARITFRRQFSCHSCHPDGHIDGLTYDIEPDGLGNDPVDNRTLRGILDTAPFKWTGINPSLSRQCGPRLAVFFTRIQPFTPEQLSALTEYICTIPRPPNRYRPLGASLTDTQRRGRAVFYRTRTNDGRVIPKEKRCHTCHPPPLYTDRSRRNVGTKMSLDTKDTFDVPHLNNIYDSAPYLHNGAAATLEEIWTRFNPYDTHGVTNDLTKDQLNDLIEYLKTL